MAKTTKKPAPKTAPKKNTELKKSIYLKTIIPAGALTLVIILAIVLLKENQQNVQKTQINTPVIARTELNKKPSIDIQLFEKDEVIEQTEEVKKTEEKAPEVNINPIVKSLTKLELNQTMLEEKLTKIEQTSNFEEISKINTKITKLESLNGNIGNLAKIFLGQQLVLLDNAFKVGGNQNLAISNIHNFAKNVAKNEKVATKLQDLLTLTNKQAIITPAALNFYAQKLETVKLSTAHTQKEEVAEDASIAEKIKAFLKSFILVRNKDELTAEQQLWDTSINQLQEAIIFANFIKVDDLLKNEELIKLGSDDYANFAKLFKTYLEQQQALQAVLGSFIEGYNYDY